MSAAVLLLGALRLAVWLLMAAAVVQLVRMAIGRPAPPPAVHVPPDHELPVVTVQLPIRNERYVAERAVRAACALDWPRGRLQVQVLDDSDDDTANIVDQTVAELAARGHDVHVVRRPNRRGFKAGHLQHALGVARGEFLAVLDADCVPPADFLRRLVPPLLADPSLAFAQGRWSFDNETQGVLTRLQALILHGLMGVEQAWLSRRRQPVQFNGSGGVWRRTALEAAGGWLPAGHASVAEDLDLSFRAHLMGYRGLHLPEVVVRTELPARMAAFRAQQQRWVRGGAQVLRALGRRGLPGAMLAHLLRHLRQPVLALFCATQPLVATGVVPLAGAAVVWTALLALLLGALSFYYGIALRRLGRSPLPALVAAPGLLALSLGMSLALSAALLRGLLEDRRDAEFVRTPKTGGIAHAAYRAPVDRLAWLEVALGGVHLVCAGHLVLHGDRAAALVTAGLVAGGLLWVGVGSLLRR
ncbi:MAG: glycosyltransferase [Myxococcales bacterium]|nr:glycosyltransferase [Myxococcota bacterium]MDW8280338.1 glycosyltransferase [Myxococcales bacterium]